MDKSKIAKIVGTVFYLGYIPLFPSSSVIGSLIGGAVFFFLRGYLYFQLTIIGLLFLFGGFFLKYLIETPGNPDPPEIIIDEVCGIMVALIGVPMKIYTVLLTYFFFHLFDGMKIFPLKRLEKLPLGWGVMSDDIMAGIYANLIVQLILRI